MAAHGSEVRAHCWNRCTAADGCSTRLDTNAIWAAQQQLAALAEQNWVRRANLLPDQAAGPAGCVTDAPAILT